MSPTAEEGGRAASSMPRQRWDTSSFPLATTPRFRASGTDLQVEGERTAYAHGCAQRAGGTTQRRHEAAPGLSPDPRQFRSQTRRTEEALRARRPSASHTQSNEEPGEKRAQPMYMCPPLDRAPRRPVPFCQQMRNVPISNRNPCTCVRRWTAPPPIRYNKCGMSPEYLNALSQAR